MCFSRPESLAASSVSDSLTLITAMNEDDSSRISMPLNVIPSERPLIESTINVDVPDVNLFVSSRPDPAATRYEDVYETNAKSVVDSIELDAIIEGFDDSLHDGTPVALSGADMEDGNLGLPDNGTLLRPIVERSHLSSADSSSSASQEVNEIFESQTRTNRPGHRSDADDMMEDEDEAIVKPSVSN